MLLRRRGAMAVEAAPSMWPQDESSRSPPFQAQQDLVGKGTTWDRVVNSVSREGRFKCLCDGCSHEALRRDQFNLHLLSSHGLPLIPAQPRGSESKKGLPRGYWYAKRKERYHRDKDSVAQKWKTQLANWRSKLRVHYNKEYREHLGVDREEWVKNNVDREMEHIRQSYPMERYRPGASGRPRPSGATMSIDQYDVREEQQPLFFDLFEPEQVDQVDNPPEYGNDQEYNNDDGVNQRLVILVKLLKRWAEVIEAAVEAARTEIMDDAVQEIDLFVEWLNEQRQLVAGMDEATAVKLTHLLRNAKSMLALSMNSDKAEKRCP